MVKKVVILHRLIHTGRHTEHRIVECFGLGGTFRGHPAQPPAVSRDIFTWVRLLRAPSNLALSVSRDGASITSLGNLGQGLTTLTVKNVFLISSLNLPSLSLKPLLLVLPLQALVKSPSPALWQPLQALAAALRSPCSLLFPRLNSPSSPSLSSQQRGSSPQIIAGASSSPAPTAPALSCAEGSRAGRRTPGGVSAEQGREAESPPLPCAHAAGDAAQGTGGLLDFQRTLLAHVELSLTFLF